MAEPAKPPKRENVRKKARALIKESWQSQANLSFFLALLVLVAFVLPSLGFGRDDVRLYSDIGLSLMLFSGVAIAWGRRKLFLLSGLIACVALVLRWMAFFTPKNYALQLWAIGWSLGAVFVIALVLLAQVLIREGPVTRTRVSRAQLRFTWSSESRWAHAYHLTEFVHPGSFNCKIGTMTNVSDFAYYSYVTLSTVGYGDITAVRPIARMLSMSEALAGQFYLAVLIARLVAMEVITWQSKMSQNSE